MKVRDLDRFRGYLDRARRGLPARGALYDPIPTVSTDGDTVLLSPELLGITAPKYADFVVGNVTSTLLPR
ncbi:hypothetical protein [Polymorphospora rubra]|uniref:hypothetical protein n=1 Tax=Polymorphospora rubra TaxID=338584 RepID=UPI003402CD48